jgi:hypothetical protein
MAPLIGANMNDEIMAWRKAQHSASLALMQVVNADWRDRNKALANIWEASPGVADIYARLTVCR